MHKKHMFLRVFSKITIFACVFCAFSAWADTTTCDINYTPVTGNSIQNGTPTPTSPVEIESVGTKVGNKYQIPVVAQGKNLCNPENFVFGRGYRVAGGTSSSNAGFANSGKITVKPNTTYSTNFDKGSNGTFGLCFFEADNTFISGISIAQHYDTFTTPSNCDYIIMTTQESAESFVFDKYLVEGSTAPTSYEPYSAPITTTVYLDEPLRKVGEYADVLDYKNGTITRNVGVKVLDGTENWVKNSTYANVYNLDITEASTGRIAIPCTHFKYSNTVHSSTDDAIGWFFSPATTLGVHSLAYSTLSEFKSWLATQYNAGTPVTVYYPLATPVVEQIENWSCIPPITDIQIATTKMVDEEFAAAEAKLATTVQTIESVVSRTITQTGQIATLHETKQTRPDESCPANMKCLLVQDEDGTPHWYPIIEP